MATTAQQRPLSARELTSSSGMRAEFTSSGALRRLDVDDRSVLLYPAGELEAGPANIYLRRLAEAVSFVPLIGPQSPGTFSMGAGGPVITGRWRHLQFRVMFRMADAVPAWFWHVEVRNEGSDGTEVDLVYAQDIALAPYEAVRTNEYYLSQYLDLTPVKAAQTGTAVGVRQNMPGIGAPWALVGSLRDAVSWGTDGLQLGKGYSGDPLPGLLKKALPSTRLQHEHTLVLLQDRPLRLRQGDRLSSGFFGIYESNHDAATSPQDAAAVAHALDQPEARAPTIWDEEGAVPVAPSRFSPPDVLECRDLTDAELGGLMGPGRRHLEMEGDVAFSFFTDRGAHLVLRPKEDAVLRPHGQILRTGNQLVPDGQSLTSTAWMAGIFHSQVTHGHASLNRLLSTKRGYVDGRRGYGLRVFVEDSETIDGWALLDQPSAWAATPESCTWWYRHPRGLIEVVARAPSAKHELTLDLRIHTGPACRFLICGNVALGDDDGEQSDPPELSADASGVTIRPPAGSAMRRRFPAGSFRLGWPAGSVEGVGGDEPLFFDGQSRELPWVTIRTVPTDDFHLTLTGALVAGDHQAGKDAGSAPWPDFWKGVGESIRLVAPDTSPLAGEIDQLDGIIPWFAQNALVHYLSPRGLEQYSGGAWGTRDVCQGPVGLLLALDQTGPIRDLLKRVFSAQKSRGDWSQWFEFLTQDDETGGRDAHGDVIFWPLLSLGEYLMATGDAGLLEERLAFVGDDAGTPAASIRDHVRRALGRIATDTIPGTSLPAYGNGDWNDSLQPAHPELAARLCSTWTVTLQIQALRTLARGLRVCDPRGADQDIVAMAERISIKSSVEMQQLLVRDAVLAGYGLFGENNSVEHLVHPSDRRTGLHYGLLHVISAISADLLSRAEAAAHLAVIQEHLLGRDGARLFDQPVRYGGGPMRVFKRAEAATFFGREIGLMYMHAHLRYAEALARFGDGRGLLRALSLANPIGIRARVPAARPRQSNCYYTSSDAAFKDRYEAAERYDEVLVGDVPLDGGWRVYSSGAGLFLRLIVESLLGLRRRADVLEIDPVLPPELDGLRATVPLAGVAMDVVFRSGPRGVGPRAVSLNDAALRTERLANPYRPPGVAVAMDELRQHLRSEKNRLAIEVS